MSRSRRILRTLYARFPNIGKLAAKLAAKNAISNKNFDFYNITAFLPAVARNRSERHCRRRFADCRASRASRAGTPGQYRPMPPEKFYRATVDRHIRPLDWRHRPAGYSIQQEQHICRYGRQFGRTPAFHKQAIRSNRTLAEAQTGRNWMEMIRNGLFGKRDFFCQTVCRDTILSLSKGLLRRNLASMMVEMHD